MDPANSLARRSSVIHPSGVKFKTPMLVPSFSTKGFRVNKERSETRDALEMASEWLTDAMLVSAYDLSHGLLPRPAELPATPELIIVDSGGYENRVDHDLSTSVHWPHAPLDWSEPAYAAELAQWPSRFAACFVSYDEPGLERPVSEQVEAAHALFEPHQGHLRTFLLKPTTGEQKYLTAALDAVSRQPTLLSGFDFIGVTEKELGASMLDRMTELARLRLALDDANIRAPIHVFGALDPLTCSLLFLSGAEVFDGLTWLRYAFRDGLCVYPSNYGVLDVGTSRRDSQVRARILTDNVHYLQGLTVQMNKFLLDRDFRKFHFHSEVLESEFDALRARLQGGG